MNVTKRIKKAAKASSTDNVSETPEKVAQPQREKNPALPELLKYAISMLLLLLGIAVVVFLSYLKEPNARVENDTLIPLVDTTPVETFQGNLDLLLSGTVVPYREIQVGAQVSGRIEKKYPECEAGTFVVKGTPLIQIDPVDYELEIKTVNSEILQAERTIQETEQDIRGAMKSLEIAQTELELQKNEYQRRLKLKSSLSPTEMDQAKRSLLSTEAQVATRQNTYDSLLARKESLKASLELNQTRLQRAEINLERTTVVAPVDGVIVRESVEEGNFVSVSNALFIIEDTSRAEVVCNLTPGELAWLRRYAGDNTMPRDNVAGVYDIPRVPVEIYEQSDPSIVWNGVLERFDGIGRNVTTKTIPCRIVVDQPVQTIEEGNRRVLVRGMFVKSRAILSAGINSSMAGIPIVAIQPGDYVWVVRDKKLYRIDVQVIDRSPIEPEGVTRMVAVKLTGDLKLGDSVVVSPLPQPIEGGEVKLRDEMDSELVNDVEPDPQPNSELSNRTNENDAIDAARGEL